MDIFNINIVDITAQYFDYIKLMKEFEATKQFQVDADTLKRCRLEMSSGMATQAEVREEIKVETLTAEDYIKPQEGNTLDWLNFMTS